MSLNLSTSNSTAREITAARQADYVAFLHRAPFAVDGFRLGFLPGFREDCSYQLTQFQDLDIPVRMLDNDFRNPDLDRYVARFFEHEPQVGVIGDAYEPDDVDEYVTAAREIQASYPEAEIVIVPKCQEVIDAVPDDIVVGYSRGYADRLAHEFSDPADWRGRRVHILGGSPPKQLDVIHQLTRPTLTAIRRPISLASTGTDYIAGHSSESSGHQKGGTTAVATLTTLRFVRQSATVSAVSGSSGSVTGFGLIRRHTGTIFSSSTRAPHRLISIALPVPNVDQMSG